MRPLVSVIIISYCNLEGIYSTLDSVLKQTYENIELVFSDDGTPGFDDEIKKIRNYISENEKNNIHNVVFNAIKINGGTVKNINSAIRLCTGYYIKALSAEDMLARSDALDMYVDFMESHNSSIVFAKMRGVTLDGKYQYKLLSCESDYDLLKRLTAEQTRNRLFRRNFLPAPAWMIRADFFQTYGLFPECVRLIEDYPYWLYLTSKGVVFDYLDEILVDYRLSGVSSAGSYSELFMKDLQVIYDEFIFPYDRRFSFLQPFYNTLKRAGLNFYIAEAKRKKMTRMQKIYTRIKYLPFWILVSSQNKINIIQNRYLNT